MQTVANLVLLLAKALMEGNAASVGTHVAQLIRPLSVLAPLTGDQLVVAVPKWVEREPTPTDDGIPK